MEVFDKLPKSPAIESAWKKYRDSMKGWLDLEKKINVSAAQAATLDPEGELVSHLLSLKSFINKDQLRPQAEVEKALNTLVEECSKSTAEASKSANITSTAAKGAAAIAVLVIGAALILLSWYIVRSILVPLDAMKRSIVNVAKSKDFTQRTTSRSSDEIGQTIRSFNELLEEMQASIREVLESASQISVAAENATVASSRVAESSNAQSEATAEMAAAVEQMTVSINYVTDNSHDALTRANAAGEDASASASIIEQGSEGMTTISHTVKEAGDTINALGKQSEQINGIMAVIKDVAEQTNLLALNAAIEAARAGESGRGFAVVADEVRKLAERTAKSTQEINAMVTSMQTSTRKAVECMKTVVSQVSEGKDLSSRASERMHGVQDSAKSVAGAVQEISNALSEQNIAAHEIAKQIEQIAQMTDQNSSAANETAEVASSLDELASKLRAAVEQFKV